MTHPKAHPITPISIGLSHDPLWMVGPCILPKLGDWDENPAANAPSRQPPSRDQVDGPAQSTFANSQHPTGDPTCSLADIEYSWKRLVG
jgi:hypothetical protein